MPVPTGICIYSSLLLRSLPPACRVCTAWYHISNSLSHSIIVLSLSTSSFWSATRVSIWSRPTHVLPSFICSARFQRSLQPDAWTPACLCMASVWVPTIFLWRAFTQVVTMAGWLCATGPPWSCKAGVGSYFSVHPAHAAHCILVKRLAVSLKGWSHSGSCFLVFKSRVVITATPPAT